ncbi:hypothetical protein OHU34_44880 (plasmid) [Streptomyces sp. NBC_00080]|uniref:hypothetical protein n=1 Tax=unclassified Streptomyces TaxID=2593676 RepID=UPI001154B7A7|nr:hypothetical protein [Streptomyces sp. SLBN-115]TQJ37772.1 hypothetical protein FBY34_7924 [Streptomyces sp. SLBN-115]
MTDAVQATGRCYCGCGKEIGFGRYFAAGHDKIAEAAFLAIHHDASVAQMLHTHGYGHEEERSVTKAAVNHGLWLECPRLHKVVARENVA